MLVTHMYIYCIDDMSHHTDNAISIVQLQSLKLVLPSRYARSQTAHPVLDLLVPVVTGKGGGRDDDSIPLVSKPHPPVSWSPLPEVG